MRAHERRGISRLAIEPIRYYGGEIRPHPLAYIAYWLDGAAMLRRAGLYESAHRSLAMTRLYRLQQMERIPWA